MKRQIRRPNSAMRHRPSRQASLRSEPPAGGETHPNHIVGHEAADRMLQLGIERPWYQDLYHRTLTIPWWTFLLGGSTVYIAANMLFAVLYLLQSGAIAHARPGVFSDAFFFSVQTMATIGYGEMSPATLYANLIVTVETVVGLMFLALATGLVFARFSRPTARVLFSQVAVIGPNNGVPTLSFRLANQRRSQILQAEVGASLVRDEQSDEGVVMRRFYDLPLARARTPIFAMTFTAMHVIDTASPLFGESQVSLAAQNAELVVTATGLDETMGQAVHARTSYLPHEVLWEHRFVDVIGWTEDGRRAIDYSRFHDTVSLTAAR